jgi:hypothetical protein
VWRAVIALGLVAAAGGAYVWLRPLLPPPGAALPPSVAAFAARLRDAWTHRPSAGPRRAPPAPAETATAAAIAGDSLATLAESVRTALRGFDDRAALFDRGHRDCALLAGSLAAVEARWETYARARAGTWVDGAHRRLDERLFTALDGRERHFEQTGCPRP